MRSAGGRRVSSARTMRRSDFSARELRESVFLDCVGTFGVTSAGYWWGRAGGGIVRLAHYLIEYLEAVWALLYSDDGKVTGQTAHPERGLLMHLLVLVLIRLPISWKKVRGGPEVECMGYLVDVGRFQIGISARRAAWISRWQTDKVAEGRMRLGELREGLGRLQFAAGPVEHLRPFLGPLYAWASGGAEICEAAYPGHDLADYEVHRRGDPGFPPPPLRGACAGFG